MARDNGKSAELTALAVEAGPGETQLKVWDERLCRIPHFVRKLDDPPGQSEVLTKRDALLMVNFRQIKETVVYTNRIVGGRSIDQYEIDNSIAKTGCRRGLVSQPSRFSPPGAVATFSLRYYRFL
jgi:hypothetical protein